MASTVDAKLLKATKFPPEFNQKVDMQKVNLEVMKKWIAGKISDILGSEDDVVIELCFNLIEGARFPDIKKMQIQLTGFLDKDTARFCKELWALCLSAQSNLQGVPKELLEAKKLELIQEKIEAEKAAEQTRRRREDDERREREIINIRNRERGGRGGGRGDSWREGRGGDRNRDDRGGGGGFDRRAPRYSRSPPRRDERDSFRTPREFDSYVPRGRGGRRRDDRARLSKSPSASPARSESGSRSPPHRRRRSTTRSRSPAPRRRRSPSPDRRGNTNRGRGGRGRGRSPDRRPRRRSSTSTDSSLSPSPRRLKRRRSPSRSVSSSPSRRSRDRRDSSSRSISSTRSPTRTLHRKERAGTTPVPDNDVAETQSGDRRGRERNERRLTRSRSRSVTPPRRRRRSPNRNRSRGDRKRRRSVQRYEPSKRRRNTSSVSSPTDTRDRKADTEDESDRGSLDREIEANNRDEAPEPSEMKTPQKQASELREKLMREKIKKMRKMSIESMEV